MDKLLLESASDDFERMVLEGVHDPDHSPADPFTREAAEQTEKIARIAAQLTSKQRQICDLHVKGRTRKQIVDEIGTSYSTIKKTLESHGGMRYLGAMMELNRLIYGPSVERRSHLLWKIAVDNHEDAPRVSIAAIDVLNKQDGIYQPGNVEAGGLTVNIKQFVMNSPGEPQQVAARDMTPPQTAEVIEGEFTPLTVETGD